jgi:hypothetical protein
MRTATDLEKCWMQQWREAAVELPRIRRQELRALTDEQALRAAGDLLALADLIPMSERRRTSSGLVDQQALFHRRRGR